MRATLRRCSKTPHADRGNHQVLQTKDVGFTQVFPDITVERIIKLSSRSVRTCLYLFPRNKSCEQEPKILK